MAASGAAGGPLNLIMAWGLWRARLWAVLAWLTCILLLQFVPFLLFTDHFAECDGLWIHLDLPAGHLEHLFEFIYHGQIVVRYDQMEAFLRTCKFLGVRLFKGTFFLKLPREVGN